MFLKSNIDLNTNLFPELMTSVKFEECAKGRKGAVLVAAQNELVPIVRTTTKYATSAQKFAPIHYRIMAEIQKTVPTAQFNNALVELYTSEYKTMGFHTDQMLDLAANSYICVYSAIPENLPATRKLVIRNKTSEEITEIPLENNSIVVFSTETNKQHVHKICATATKGDWFGITFRLSKTFIEFRDNTPYFVGSDKILRLADDSERAQFCKFKKEENNRLDFIYPELDYTISASDLKLPENERDLQLIAE